MTRQDILNMKVALLSGGWSDEKEISLESGHACYKALEKAGFTSVDFIDVSEQDFLDKLQAGNYDVAFIVMHGRYGEDGCIQGLLEVLKIPYTFSGVMSSAISAEKNVAKTMYRSAGIPVPEGREISHSEAIDDALIDSLVDELKLPLFVKPACNGSSFGVTKVFEKSQLKSAIEKAFGSDGKALVEQCIEGTEITVPVIGNDDPQALPIIEIVTNSEFYDLKVKYEPAELHHVCPARLDSEVYARAQELAVKAHKALSCAGASRSDFIVTSDDTPVILETNSIPGMTESSLMPDSARHAGIEFDELCYKFIEFALQK